MIDMGLVDEVKNFYDQKIFTKPLIGGIGYKELYQYFAQDISYEDAIDSIKRNSRRYAKRQYTFLRNKLDIKWFNTDYSNFCNTVNEVSVYIENNIAN